MPTLLTGVGYIGAALLRRLAERPDAQPIVALENFFSTSREQVHAALLGGTRLVVGDVADPNAVARAFDALTGSTNLLVFHLAAQPSAGIATHQPELTERSNLVGARLVLEAARERGARVVFGGSFRVYGDDLADQTVDEATPYGRVSDLSHLSKVYVEQLARMLSVRFASVRLGVTYGVSPIMKSMPAFMTVPNLFCQRAARGEVLRVFEDRPVAFIHVEDAAAALIKAADRLGPVFDIVNAAPEVATISQVAHTVKHLVQQRGEWVHVEGAASSKPNFRVASRLDETGFQARHTLEDSLGEVVDLFMAQR